GRGRGGAVEAGPGRVSTPGPVGSDPNAPAGSLRRLGLRQNPGHTGLELQLHEWMRPEYFGDNRQPCAQSELKPGDQLLEPQGALFAGPRVFTGWGTRAESPKPRFGLHPGLRGLSPGHPAEYAR